MGDFRVIPENEYTSDLEDKVKYYLSVTPDLPKNDIKPRRAQMPNVSDPYEQSVWCREEFRRCREGHFGYSGKYYFWYNYCKIWDIERGQMFFPDFRTAQVEWFRQISEAQKTKEWGLICVKRRRVGASWLEAADVLHDCLFYNIGGMFKAGMMSKTKEDGEELFRKVKFIYDNLPIWMKPASSAGNTVTSLVFGWKQKDPNGNWQLKGLQSEIKVKPPTDTAWEGYALQKFVADECFSPDTPVKMADGTNKQISDIKIGDLVAGDNLTPRTVIQITNGVDEMFRVETSRGSFVCNSNHLLTVKYNGSPAYTDIPLKEFLKKPKDRWGYFKLTKAPVEFPEKKQPFDPYWFGLWLGDGRSNDAEVCTNDPEIEDFLSKYTPSRFHKVSRYKYGAHIPSFKLKYGKCPRIFEATDLHNKKHFFTFEELLVQLNTKPQTLRHYLRGGLDSQRKGTLSERVHQQFAALVPINISPVQTLKNLGVFNNKHIPHTYLRGSREQRLSLLAGIIDSDGTRTKSGIAVNTIHHRLALDMQELGASLGLNSTLTERTATLRRPNKPLYTRQIWVVSFYGHTLCELPIRLKRKSFSDYRVRRDTKNFTIKNIVPLGPGNYVGIKLKESPYFLLGDYTVVHNCGKISNLKQIFSYAVDVMMVGNRRVGTPVLFGTAGDITKEGRDFKEMWYNADTYKLRQFFFGGWMGLAVDEYGNDLKEDAIRWIVYERKRLEGLSQKEYNDFLQKYPLTVQEAFTSNESQGLGNQVKINKQLNSLYENPVKAKRGFFKLDSNKKPVFVPSGRGACIIYEDPDPVYQNLYIGGVDPTDHEVEEGRKDVSSLALYIMKKRHGVEAPKIVFEYVDRPAVPRDFYDQALLACLHYNNTKLMVEKNKPGIITYFDEAGYKHLLATKPNSYERLVLNNTWNIGYIMDKKTTMYAEELVAEYIEDYSDIIPSKGLLEECINYGITNTDRVSAFMAVMLLLKEDKWEAKAKTDKSNIPRWKYIMRRDGTPVKVK